MGSVSPPSPFASFLSMSMVSSFLSERASVITTASRPDPLFETPESEEMFEKQATTPQNYKARLASKTDILTHNIMTPTDTR